MDECRVSPFALRAPRPSDFPLVVLSREGEVVAIAKPAVFATLPFSARRLDQLTVASLAELAKAGVPVARAWRIRCKLTISLDFAWRRHWLLLRRTDACASASPHFQRCFAGTMESLCKLEAALAASSLFALAASACCQIYLVSEPEAAGTRCSAGTMVAASTVSHHERHVKDASYDQVAFGDTVADIAAFVVDLLCRQVPSTATLDAAGCMSPTLQPTWVFWPAMLTYPVNICATSDAMRRAAHDGLLLPSRRPLLHWSQRVTAAWPTADLLCPEAERGLVSKDAAAGAGWRRHLISNPHLLIRSAPRPNIAGAETHVVHGADYDYYHYRVDGVSDEGWGCAYRSLQTILSWFQHAGLLARDVPSLREIQAILALTDPDKTSRANFVGSSEWIGSYEIMLVLQYLMPGLECTIRRLESGGELDHSPEVQSLLLEHFRRDEAPPVMIGGSSYAHTIAGIYVNPDTTQAQYLVLDPHYSAKVTNIKVVLNKGYIGWKQADKFADANSWYNLCLPRVDLYDPR